MIHISVCSAFSAQGQTVEGRITHVLRKSMLSTHPPYILSWTILMVIIKAGQVVYKPAEWL